MWSNAIAATTLCSRHEVEVLDGNLCRSVKIGVLDKAEGEVMSDFTKQAIRYAAGNDALLFGHIQGLYSKVSILAASSSSWLTWDS